ncbi:hypothetical protein BBP40_007343 [Aspergillus hancockii]|nr:hypothetical protein BBP40_007343 [Aspergillus hancockii]
MKRSRSNVTPSDPSVIGAVTTGFRARSLEPAARAGVRNNWAIWVSVLHESRKSFYTKKMQGLLNIPPESAQGSHNSRSTPDSQNAQSLAFLGLRRVHFGGLNLGSISCYNGIPFFSPRGQQWVQARTGEAVTSEKLCSLGPPWQNQRSTTSAHLSPSQRQQTVELPDKAAVEECAAIYMSSGPGLMFPLVDTSLFSETLQRAYHPSDGSYSHVVAHAKACIFAFLAFVTTSNLHCSALSGHDGEGWSLEAHYLMPEVVECAPTLDGLQTIVMLALYKTLSGDFRSVDMFVNIASRLIFTLGGHVCSSSEYAGESPAPSPLNRTPQARSHLRKLFWICYIIDKEMCLRTGRPSSLNDSECDLTLPGGYVQQAFRSPGSSATLGLDPSSTVFPTEIRLSIIKSRTYAALYSAHALRKTDTELLRAIRELDDDLEHWRVSLPADIRPTVSFSQQEISSNRLTRMTAIILRLEYHYCMATLHQASSRCRAWAENLSGAMEGVSSSLELSVQASRSSLLYLHAARHVLEKECFWYIIFYPMSALLTLFCNVLQSPLDAHITEDLQLLEEAPTLLRDTLSLQRSLNEMIHIKSVEEFMSMLGRLAKCAVEKAKQESSYPDSSRSLLD